MLEIDISGSNNEENGEDLMKIKMKSQNTVHINFSKFLFRSKYVCEKCSEIMNSIEREIAEVENKYEIKEESIKKFIEIISEDKVSIPIEHYKDIYTLSKHFCIPKLTNLLDKMMSKLLANDLDFSIQILLDLSEKETKNEEYTELVNKIENFLKTRVNECMKNEKFKELSIPTIYRIIQSTISKYRETVDFNKLLEFILESAKNRFIIFKFIELDRLKNDKIDEFIKFIDSQEESSKQIYLEYIPFNFLFLKQLKHNYDELSNNFDQIQEELKRTQVELTQKKEESKQIQEALNIKEKYIKQNQEELKQVKEDLEKTKNKLKKREEELLQTKEESKQNHEEFKQTKEELKLTKEKLKQSQKESSKNFNKIQEILKRTQEDLKQTQEESKQVKEELKQAKEEQKETQIELKLFKKQYTHTIMVGGRDEYNQLGQKPNKKYGKYPAIHPPLKSFIDPSSLLSFSIYCYHSIQITRSGKLLGIGDNRNGLICDSLPKAEIKQFTEFSIRDSNGHQLDPISAVCCFYGTLYMFSSGSKRQLVLCDRDINGGHPVFLDIGDEQPVSLFGGCNYSAAITNKGEVIFINRDAVKKSPESKIASVSLPDGEKAVSVACCKDSVVALSSKCRVFWSDVRKESSGLNFSTVAELSNQEIVCVSGVFNHFLAVSREGRVFGRGSNEDGRMGFEQQTSEVSSFTVISSLNGHKIRAAYAGGFHSLFETCEGKILACGYNNSSELLLSSESRTNVYIPTETTIFESAKFCIVGACFSAVFIGGDPPPNTPNRLLHEV